MGYRRCGGTPDYSIECVSDHLLSEIFMDWLNSGFCVHVVFAFTAMDVF